MRVVCLVLLASIGSVAGAAPTLEETRQLAADQGCYNCHGQPPRRNVPSLREIVDRYARYRRRLDAATQQQLADRLHHGGVFSHVAAHERLTEAQAAQLVRWLVEGAP